MDPITRRRAAPLSTVRHIPLLLLLLIINLSSVQLGRGVVVTDFTRDDFPPGFLFGAGTSAYQYEGAVAEDGRTPSIWDTFTHNGGMQDKSTADVTADGYHKYKEDIKLMLDLGVDAYRLSISWSRLIPNGRGEVNPKGLKYYNDVIDELIKHGIQPHVTLFHLDLPQSLEDEYGGWLSPKIVDDFAAYADVCFAEFGDRVGHWTTVNEPNILAMGAYDSGLWPPSRCSRPFGLVPCCAAGNSTTEPYIVLHHLLLAHAAAANLYKTKYQAAQKGLVGANVYTFGFSPFTNSTADAEATKRAMHFLVGWVMSPLVDGDYPEIMRKNVGRRLPAFTEQQSAMVKNSFDFIGQNHYTTLYIKDDGPLAQGPRDINSDMAATMTAFRNETPSSGTYVPRDAPYDEDGMERILDFLRTEYGNPPMYVQENGFPTRSDVGLNDTERIQAIKGYTGAVLGAIRSGSNIKGYFVWALLDLFEVLSGYQTRLGLYHVDFEDRNRTRVPKSSAFWYRDFLKTKTHADF